MSKYLLPIICTIVCAFSIFLAYQAYDTSNLALKLSVIANKDSKKIQDLGARTDDGGWDVVAGNGYFNGKVAVGTTTFNGTLSVYSSGTTTLELLTGSTTSISCLKTKNNSGTGVGYTSFFNGTPSSTTAAACGY